MATRDDDTKPLVTDEQSIAYIHDRFGHDIRFYDDGYGQLYIMRDSMGIMGIVRARTWEDAYEICEDEFFPEAGETWEEMTREYSTQYLSGRELWLHEHGQHWEDWQALSQAAKDEAYRAPGKDVPFTQDCTEHPCWQESYGFRPNGPNTRDTIQHGIYQKDLNGESLDRLTRALADELGIIIGIEEVSCE